MMTKLEQYKERVNKISGMIEEKNNLLESALLKKKELSNLLPIKKEAINLTKKCLERSLEQKKYIEDIISSALSEVFGIKYTFILEQVVGTDGNIKGLKPRLKEADGEFDDPINSFGACAQAIASICFRISVLLLSSGTAKVLILDEPLANINPVLQDRFKIFIENICKETGLQLIMVTHLDDPFGVVYQVVKEGKAGKRTSKVVLQVKKEEK